MNDTITITGNVATEPEHKRTPAGVTITTFRVASGQRRFDRASNAWVDSATNWYSVSAFRSLADHAFHSLRKGDRVILTGRLRVRDWDNGTKRGTAVEIDAEAIGHDLLWGTTTFTKDAPSTAAEKDPTWETADPSDSGTDSVGSPAEDWAAPGASRGDEATWTPTDDADRALALTGAEPPF
ncbi:single-stranded DNA-binding protein [Microbacterium sulfonylureivorans]|uniref:single-stranded DNA-binding protein n=1 Tax=Microbacterium sulfonylureivorans TaxID=2486854 RepID=UPI000FD813B4|nr:single-stranded DNA-binding protein [Microbacterium sulfonylureivorans]